MAKAGEMTVPGQLTVPESIYVYIGQVKMTLGPAGILGMCEVGDGVAM